MMRQKACDLCFTKKIKCDYAQPACSNCLLYRAKCHTSIVRSKAKPPRPAGVSARRRVEVQEHVSAVSSRLDKVESKLDELLDHRKDEAGADSREEHRKQPSWRFNPLSPSLYSGPADETQYLPPQEDIIPIVDLYFDTCNNVLPLFSRDSFMRSVTAWYGGSARDRPTWGSILAVIALGLQSRHHGERSNPIFPRTGHLSDYCIRNAQGILPELMARGDDLTGIRVVTALVILYFRTSDACPAIILMGMASALCRRLQLHCHNTPDFFTADEIQQRSQVFWVLYIIDQDVALRAKTPAALPGDADLDVPLPRASGEEMIRTTDESAEIDILSTRISLAKIEGEVYQLLYSGQSRKIPASERHRRVANLHSSLVEWYALIPPQLQLEAVSSSVSDIDLAHMTNLYHVYMLCLIATHGIYSTQAEWIRSVGSLARAAVHDFAAAMHGPRVVLCMQNQTPPLRQGWDHCAEVARGTIHLFQVTPPTEALAWQCSCAHFSALIILLADVVSSPGQLSMLSDYEAASISTELFSKLIAITETPAYKALGMIITELHRSATVVVDAHQSEEATTTTDASELFEGFPVGSDLDLNLDDDLSLFRQEPLYYQP